MTYACDQCGECCNGRLWVEARADDVLREPRIANVGTRIVVGANQIALPVLDQAWALSMVNHPCVFLRSDSRCDIYPTRPACCVAFQPGSERCQELRERAGLPRLEPVEGEGVIAEIVGAMVEAGDE